MEERERGKEREYKWREGRRVQVNEIYIYREREYKGREERRRDKERESI